MTSREALGQPGQGSIATAPDAAPATAVLLSPPLLPPRFFLLRLLTFAANAAGDDNGGIGDDGDIGDGGSDGGGDSGGGVRM
mmetsp:Transcript_38726/g.78101  ORF Transcript_38726/g.78101 Transcript_38726/m.78101 type:complete len:82 (-) Transcript_38726:311-556(-)